MNTKKRYIRLKSATSLLVPGLIWAFVVAYIVGSKNVIWTDGFLAMRVCIVLLLIFTAIVVKNEFVVMSEEEYLAWKETRRQAHITAKTKRNFIMFIVLGVYMLLLNPLGFAIATAILIFGVMLWLGVRKIPILVLVPILTSGILFYVFKYLLYIRLPLGLLEYIL